MCFRAAGVRIRGLGCRVLGFETVGLFMRVDRISIKKLYSIFWVAVEEFK